MDGDHLADTTSLCPACLDPAPGAYEARDGSVFLTRTCPDHGTASRTVWESVAHWRWAADVLPEAFADGSDAEADSAAIATDGEPTPDGLTVDNDHACLAVVEVTTDCNLSCSYCFASSGPGGTHLPFEAVVDLLDTVRAGGGPRPIQFSGGEPTVRDDLPELVETAREMGFGHVQVNTNGIRLAEEDGYADRLVDAGVTAVYLQFDGLTAETYRQIREVDLLETKHAAIEACRAAGLSVVLVPTVVPGVNDDEMGDVVRFALANRDTVQSVNVQPVAHFGRYAEHHGGFSLDEAARRLAATVDGLEPRDFVPVPCCSAYCQSGTALAPTDDGPVALTRFLDGELVGDLLFDMVDEADWMELLARTPAGSEGACCAGGCCGVESPLPGDAGEFFDDVLPVSITGFMDADAADADRLEDCCIAVPTPDGELVPFCGYNMTTDDGEYALRNRYGWGGRPAVDAPARRSGDPAATEDD